MSLGVSLIVYSPGQTVKSSDMNTNLSALNNAAINADTLKGGGNLPGGKLGVSTDGDIMDASGAGIIFKRGTTFNDGLGNAVVFTGSNGIGFSKGGGDILGQSTFSGSGAGTYTHGMSIAPSFVGITTTTASSTFTVGVDTIGATTVHVNLAGGATTFVGIATKS